MSEMIVTAKHAIADIRNVDFDTVENVELVESSLVEAANLLDLEVVSGPISHKFEPQGLTSIVLLATSHISVHTYPELGLVKCDAFSCGRECPSGAIEHLARVFKGEVSNMEIIERGDISVG
jgi:S-adenosylmethionine decarboxylase